MFISCFYVFTSVAVTCDDPPTIPNGSRTFTDKTIGETATYICDDGYQRSGSAAVMCQASGSWSTRPSCNGEQYKWYKELVRIKNFFVYTCYLLKVSVYN